MTASNIFNKKKPTFLLVLGLYSAMGLCLLPFFMYQINPDGISYISVARQYLRGDFTSAINGYWGPLMSWLFMPFLFLQIPPLLVAKLVSLIVGFFTLYAAMVLSYHFQLSARLRAVMFFVFIPLILYFSMSGITPDLLMICLSLFYCSVIFSSDYSRRIRHGVTCGAIGGFLYLTKSYGFPFFITHFLVFNALHYFSNPEKDRRTIIGKNMLLGLVVFLVISGTWIALISAKYGEITIGTAGSYNFALASPDYRGLPMFSHGLQAPSSPSASTVWEDPTIDDTGTWNPLESFDYFIHFLARISNNIQRSILLVVVFSPLSMAIGLGAILLCLPLTRETMKSSVFFSLITVLILHAGYLPFYVMLRYVWISHVFIVLLGYHLVHVTFGALNANRTRMFVVMTILLLSFLYMPVTHLFRLANTGKAIYLMSRELRAECDIAGNAASNVNWEDTAFLAFHNGFKYLGTTGNDLDDDELEETLTHHEVDYFVVWGNADDNSEFLDEYEEITAEEIDGLRIYQLVDSD